MTGKGKQMDNERHTNNEVIKPERGTPVDSLVSHLSRSDIFAISQLLSAATAIDVAYTTLQLIPNRAAFDLKIDLAKELRRLRELHEQAVNAAVAINA